MKLPSMQPSRLRPALMMPALMKPARMNPPTVLLDGTFVEALVDTTAAQHATATSIYRGLVEQYGAEQVLLVATAPSLRSVPRSIRGSLLAPVAGVHVATRFRWAAPRVSTSATIITTATTTTTTTTSTTTTIDPDFATLLVLLRRERINRVASFDPRFAAIVIAVERLTVTAGPSTDGGDDDQSNAA